MNMLLAPRTVSKIDLPLYWDFIDTVDYFVRHTYDGKHFRMKRVSDLNDIYYNSRTVLRYSLIYTGTSAQPKLMSYYFDQANLSELFYENIPIQQKLNKIQKHIEEGFIKLLTYKQPPIERKDINDL